MQIRNTQYRCEFNRTNIRLLILCSLILACQFYTHAFLSSCVVKSHLIQLLVIDTPHLHRYPVRVRTDALVTLLASKNDDIIVVQNSKNSKIKSASSKYEVNSTIIQNRAIYIGNIDWNKSQEEITQLILSKITGYCENIVLTKEQLFMKQKTNKKRDEHKLHGGSLIITFDNYDDAEFVMKTLSGPEIRKEISLLLNPNIVDDGDSGLIKIRWSIDPTEMQNNTIGRFKQEIIVEQQKMNKPAEANRKLIEHRKNRALKYQRQRRRIAERTDAILDYIRPHFIPSSSIDTLYMGSSLSDTSQTATKSSASERYIDWSSVPEEVDPMRGGKLRADSRRGFRKQAQVEAFVYVLLNALLCIDDDSATKQRVDGRIKVADLGCGGGNLSIPLAWFLRHHLATGGTDAAEGVQVVAVDINSHALKRLDDRAKDIGLDILTVKEDLLKLISSSKESSPSSSQTVGDKSDERNSILDSCSAVVSLHACGAASDLAIHSAVSHSLPFAISPCCIGKVKSIRDVSRLPSMATQRAGTPSDGTISYPRSESLSSLLGEYESNDGGLIDEYSLLLSAADYSMSDGFVYNPFDNNVITDNVASNFEYISNMSEQDQAFHRRGKMAKLIVETDRLKWAEEQGYFTRLMELPKLGATYPKRELLLGAKMGTLAAKRISRLPSRSTQLWAKLSDDDDEYEVISDQIDIDNDFDNDVIDSMDLGGFANYLAPYALALLGSIIVTAAFFKYVLLDY